MSHTKGGYTFIEVMIVVSVSAVIFTTAVTLFRNSDKNVKFTHSVADFESKLKSYIKDVSTGAFEENIKYTCKYYTTSGRPILEELAATTPSSNEDCIYLGKMISPTVGSNTVYFYDVLGLRNVWSSTGTDTRVPVKDIVDANPTPALVLDISGTVSFAPEYAISYELLEGVTVLSAKAGADPSILKIYSDLQASNTTLRSITSFGASFSAPPTDRFSDRYRQCIEKTSGECTTEYLATNTASSFSNTGWTVCLRSPDDDRAQVTAKPSSGGVVTSVSYVSCT